MSKKVDYNEVVNRMGYFRTQANLSMREMSFRLGYTEQFIKRIENKSVELKVKTLLDFCDIVVTNVIILTLSSHSIFTFYFCPIS